jgi:hypothetical protein
MKFEAGAVVVETGKPDAFYARLTEIAASGEFGGDRGGDVAGRQPPGGLPVSGEVTDMSETATPRPLPAAPGFLTSAIRIFDLSLGEMLWSRRTIFMLLVVGAPVVIATLLRLFIALGAPVLDSTRMTGPGIFGLMIWVFYLRFTIPVLGVFYGTSLMADEVEDKTITYLFTRPIPKGRCWWASISAYLACTLFVVLPSCHRLLCRSSRCGAAWRVVHRPAEGSALWPSGWRSTGRCSRSSAPGSSARCWSG